MVCVCAAVRGCDADLVILEEAAFITQPFFNAVIVPLIGVNQTAILAISTPGEGDSNYYNLLLDLKDEDGAPMFLTIEIGLACDVCRDEGKAADCTHTRVRLPPWKSKARQRKQRRILAQTDPEVMAREVMGVTVSEGVHPFNPVLLRAWDSPEQRVHLKNRASRVIFLSIDPAGGGNPSEFALCGLMYYEQRYTVSSQ